MTEPEMDTDGYPTDETLTSVREWSYKDLSGLFAFLQRAWKFSDYFGLDDKGGYVIATGSPLEILNNGKRSYTAKYLRKYLGNHSP